MIDLPATKESRYSELFEAKQKHGITRLGLMINQVWNQDPKRTLFTLARYKFVARMLAGRKHVLEVGCADAFGTRIVHQAVGKLTAIDFDPIFIADVKERMNPHWPLEAFHRQRGEFADSVGIFGMPSLESQTYASSQSRAGHVNCKPGEGLRHTLEQHFHSVFVFSMNDEVVHTGFYPMSHYLLGLACHRRGT
jgi:hypothetical protein